jgi:pyridoxine 5-phosphate synthase
MMNKRLTIAIDDIANIRQTLRENTISPVQFAVMAEVAGVQGVSLCYQEQNGLFTEEEVKTLRNIGQTQLNLRLPLAAESLRTALSLLPNMVTFCHIDEHGTPQPIRDSHELDILSGMITDLRTNKVSICVYCAPEIGEIKRLSRLSIDYVEFDCRELTSAPDTNAELVALDKIHHAAMAAAKLGFGVNLYGNISQAHLPMLAAIPKVEDICMGVALLKRSLWVGIDKAVQEALQQMLFYQREV